MKRVNAKITIKILLFSFVLILVILMCVSNLELFQSIVKGDTKSVRIALSGNLYFAYLIMFITMMIQNSFTVIPLIVLITINFILFGFIKGLLWSWATSVLAAAVVFILVRHVFQDKLLKKFHRDMVAKVERDGFIYVFQGRIFPFVPTSVVNILAGLSSIRFKDFIFGTIYGNLIYFFILTLIPAGFISANSNVNSLVIIIFIFISLLYGIRKLLQKKRQKSNENE